MRVPYGEDHLISVPLITAGGTDFLASIPTIAAGDAKIDPDTVMVSAVREPGLQVNPDAFILGFDSMSVLPSPGDQISEAVGDGVATVMFVVAVAGTNLTTGDISGFMFVKGVTGTWTDDQNIDNDTTAATNIATVDAGTTGTYTLAGNQIANTAGLFAFAKGKAWLAITGEELTCKELEWRLKDQTATEEWEDTSGVLETEDHPAAKYPNGAKYAFIIGDPANDLVSATAFRVPQSGHADAHDWFDDAAWILPAVDNANIVGLTAKVWDPTDRDVFQVAQIEAWDADGGGANEGQLTFAGRGMTNEPALDNATTLRCVVYEDYLYVIDALETQAKADVNAEADTALTDIGFTTANVAILERLMSGAVVAQVNDAGATTTDFAADGFTEATDDHFNGRLITFVTGALAGQQTDITDYDAAGGAQGAQQFTVTALTEAPADGDFFVIH